MTDIPHTRGRFAQMDFDSQNKVKQRLLRQNFSRMCDALSTETLREFAIVLHSGDLEELSLSKARHSRSTVIADLLMRIPRSLRTDPSWWELLDQVLQNHNCFDLYYAMNPWEQRVPGGAADGGRGDGDGRGDGGGGRGDGGGGRGKGRGRGDQGGGRQHGTTPSTPGGPTLSNKFAGGPGPTAMSRASQPYHKSTPLAQTAGIARLLQPLWKEGNDLLWRDLAEALGLCFGDQLSITKQSEGKDNMHILLLQHFISRYEDAATVHCLVTALLALGEEGRRVVREMEQKKVICPVETEGSEAVGEVVRVCGDEEREGGTSARLAQAPTPTFPSEHGNNLLHGQFEKEGLLKNKFLCPERKESSLGQLQRSSSEVTTGTPRPPTLPHCVSSPDSTAAIGRQYTNDLENGRYTSTNSIIDNASQEVVEGIPPQLKVLNTKPGQSSSLSPDTRNDGMDDRRRSERQSSTLQADAPSGMPHSPGIGEETRRDVFTQSAAPDWIQESQQDKEYQLLASQTQQAIPTTLPVQNSESSSQGDTQARGGTDATVNINTFITVRSVKNMQVGENRNQTTLLNAEKQDARLAQDEATREELSSPAHEVFAASTEHAETFGYDQAQTRHPRIESRYCEESSEDSFHPDPTDSLAQATYVKQPYSEEEEEEEEEEVRQSVIEEQLDTEQDFDIASICEVRGNPPYPGGGQRAGQRTESTSSSNAAAVLTGNTLTTPSGGCRMPGTAENSSVDDVSSLPPQQQHHQQNGLQPPPPQPQVQPQPQPQQGGGLMNRLSQALASIKDAFLDME